MEVFSISWISSFWVLASVIIPCVWYDNNYDILYDPINYLPCFLSILGTSNLADIKDIEEDRELGINTWPVLFGKQNSAKISIFILLLSSYLLAINEKLVLTLEKVEKRVQKANENTVDELQLITKALINELNKNSQVSIENNKKLSANLVKLNRSNSKTISKAIQQISNKAIYKQIVANQAIQAQQISKLVKQNNNVLGKIADKTSRIKYP